MECGLGIHGMALAEKGRLFRKVFGGGNPPLPLVRVCTSWVGVPWRNIGCL
jgi:hypothetical protein